jgi:hypothetical protein
MRKSTREFRYDGVNARGVRAGFHQHPAGVERDHGDGFQRGRGVVVGNQAFNGVHASAENPPQEILPTKTPVSTDFSPADGSAARTEDRVEYDFLGFPD